ncbi:MAG TPA: dipeptide epimerase [Bacteroidia bacterium]|nr:dipeptide epimerase [Bacteroidia bacterium]
MKLSYVPYSLQFKHPFGLSYGSRTTTEVVYIKLEYGGFIGYGEAALPPYLNETQTSVIDFLKKASAVLKDCKLPFVPEKIINIIDTIDINNNAAKACIDIALHDLLGKYLNKPVYALLDLEKPEPKNTSVTISIGELNLIPEKIKELEDYNILKIKLGNKNDKEIIERIRAYTNKPLVVDVNQGWADKYMALEMIEWLSMKNVLFIEQPLAKNNFEEMAWLNEHSPITIIADESMQRFSDMDKITGCFKGINLKLMKCAGLFEAVKIIHYAKQKGLKINVGCMSESSCGIAAAAQLMQYVDWIDLDGPLLIKNNPFAGVDFKAGKLTINNTQGTGVELINKELNFTTV